MIILRCSCLFHFVGIGTKEAMVAESASTLAQIKAVAQMALIVIEVLKARHSGENK